MPRLDVTGRFTARVLESNTYVIQAQTGNFQVAIPFEVTSPEAHAGKHATYFRAITDKTVDDLAARLADVFSYDGNLEDLYQGQCPFVGAECNITAEQDGMDGQGNPRIVVAWINPLGGGGFKKPEEGDFRGFMSRFGRRFQAVATSKLKEGGKATIQRKAAPTEPADQGGKDELPF